jgi:hypothetical protein
VGIFYGTILTMNELQPVTGESKPVIENVEFAVKKVDREIPYALDMEKKEIMDLFRGANPENPETKRLAILWMDEARKSVDGFETGSFPRESAVEDAQKNLLIVTSLLRLDKIVDPEALLKFNAWLEKNEAWVSEEEGEARLRRQIILEIARSDVYLSVGDEEEAYNCLDQAISYSGDNDDLAKVAQDKINAITEVLNFFNQNAKKSE